MLTDAQIETFVALADEAGYCFEPEDVAQTQDTLADFIAKWGRADDVQDGLHVWFKVQAAKGQPRRDLMVYDFGNARAAKAM
ncbi:MAG: hypothetical protein ACOYBT_09835 [Polynucleobacter sp.]